MLPDAATVARHPALAEFRLMELEARCATLEAALQSRCRPSWSAPRSPNNPRRWSSAQMPFEEPRHG